MPTDKNTTPSFAIKITEEMLEPYKTHKAKGGLVKMIDIFEVGLVTGMGLPLCHFICSVRRTFKKQGATGFPLQDSK